MISVPVVQTLSRDGQGGGGHKSASFQLGAVSVPQSKKPRGNEQLSSDQAVRQWKGGAPLLLQPGQVLEVSAISPLRASMNLQGPRARASTSSCRSRNDQTGRLYHPQHDPSAHSITFAASTEDLDIRSQRSLQSVAGASCVSGLTSVGTPYPSSMEMAQDPRNRPHTPTQRPASPLTISPFRQHQHKSPQEQHSRRGQRATRTPPLSRAWLARMSSDSLGEDSQSMWSHSCHSPQVETVGSRTSHQERASTAPDFQSLRSSSSPQYHRTEILRRHRELESRRSGRLRALGSPSRVDAPTTGSFLLPSASVFSGDLSRAWTATGGHHPGHRPWVPNRRSPKYHPDTVRVADNPSPIKLL